ncbi:hypothetical protein BSKO_05731 [Bryopsis sp. KO-2023]|nr:hypothetical protein BSKO_05731 [Bryopsis sp. KO-2023]
MPRNKWGYALLGIVLLCAGFPRAQVAAQKEKKKQVEKEKASSLSQTLASRHPYIVSIRSTRRSSHLCNGVLVGNRTVLTAAHCMDVRQSTLAEPNPEVWVGTFTTDELDESIAVVRKVVRFKMHPKYRGNRRKGYDMASLQLDEAVVSERHRPIRLMSPKIAEIIFQQGSPLGLLGFGRTSARSGAAPVLQLGFMNYIENKECNRKYFKGAVTKSMLCAGETASGACTGDDGAPLILLGRKPQLDILVGVVSIPDSRCGTTSSPVPSVFAPVHELFDFIASSIEKFDVDEPLE